MVFQEGDIGLIRTHTNVSKDTIYVPFNGRLRARVDIGTYSGTLFTPEQSARLQAERDRLEAEAEALHQSSPFATYDSDGLAFSPDIDPRLRGLVADFKQLLFPGAKVYVSTTTHVDENKNALTGPFRRMAATAVEPNIQGITQPLGPGEHYILLTPQANISKMVEALAHEMGHIHQKEAFENASPEERDALLAEHKRWVESTRGKSAKAMIASMRPRIMGRTVDVAEGLSADQFSDTNYWKSFSEWYADQMARWAVSNEKPLTIVERYFSRLAQALRNFYRSLRGQGYLPTETFKKFVEKTSANLDLTPPSVVEQQEAALTYEDVLDEIEGAFQSDPAEGKPQEIDAKAYRLLKQAAENQRATPDELMNELERYKDKYAEETGLGGPQAARTSVEDPAVEALRKAGLNIVVPIDTPSLNPDEDITFAEQTLQNTPGTVENLFPANLARPRAESIGFAAGMQERRKKVYDFIGRKFDWKYKGGADYSRALASAYGVGTLPEDMDVERRFELLESRKTGNQMRLAHTYLRPIDDLIRKLDLDLQDIGMYLWARSAKDRNALVNKSSGDVFDGSGMTNAEAQAVLDHYALSGLMPKLQQVAKLHDKLVDYMLNEKVRAGLLSKAQRDALRKEQPFYTPLKGYAQAGDMQVDGDPDAHSDLIREEARNKRGTAMIQEYIKARGRESMPFNPLFNLMTDAQTAIARMERNRVGRTFLNNVLSDPVSHKSIVKVFSTNKHPATTRVGGDALTAMKNRARNGEVFVVKKDGETYFLQFERTSEGVAMERAFANMTPEDLPRLLKPIQILSNNIKSLLTRWNPIYLGTSAWLRDWSEAIITNYIAQGLPGGPAQGKKIAARTAKYTKSVEQMEVIGRYIGGSTESRAIVKLVGAAGLAANRARSKGPDTPEGEHLALLFDQFLEDGGAVGHANIMEAETLAEDTIASIKRYAGAKKGNPIAASGLAKDAVLDAMDTTSQMIDMQARFATYRAAIEAGISRDGAASLALNSSLNLTRRGEWAPFLDSWFFFFSPTKEGTRKLINQGRYGRLGAKVFTSGMVAGAVLYLFNRFIAGGDDDEDDIPNILEVNKATAQSRIIIRYGSGINDYVGIPVAFGMAYFNYVGGQLAAASVGDLSPTAAATNIVTASVDLMAPIKADYGEGVPSAVVSLAPDFLQPFADVAANRNYFGSPIYREQGYSTTPRSQLGREETGEFWKMTADIASKLSNGTTLRGGAVDFQPEAYRYVVQQYLAGLYRIGQDATNLLVEEPRENQTLTQRIPFVRSFVGKGGEFIPMNKYYQSTRPAFGLRSTPDMRALQDHYNNEDMGPELWEATWQEEREAFPVHTDDRVMQAFIGAEAELKRLSDANRSGEFSRIEDYYAATNEVYKEFNRVFNEVRREYQNR